MEHLVLRSFLLKRLDLQIESIVDIVHWVHFFLFQESTEQELGGILNVAQSFQVVVLLLEEVMVVQRWSDLVSISSQRNQLVVSRGELGDLLFHCCECFEICLDSFLRNFNVLLNRI